MCTAYILYIFYSIPYHLCWKAWKQQLFREQYISIECKHSIRQNDLRQPDHQTVLFAWYVAVQHDAILWHEYDCLAPKLISIEV